MSKLVIFGAGDIAKLAHHYFTKDSDHEVHAFCVDREYIPIGGSFCGLPVVPFDELARLYPPSEFSSFAALSYSRMNRDRAECCSRLQALGYRLVSYVSSRCTYLSDSTPGENCFILENNTIQPFAQIGSNVTLWSGNHIGHDSVIEDHCFITSQVVVSGHVRIKPYCFLGVNSTLRNSITLAEETLIGAGAVIMKDTKPREVYLPERAKLFQKSSDQIEL